MLYVVGSVSGVTQLGDVVYVVCYKSSSIKTFTDALSPLADIHVEGMMNPTDIAVCRDDRQLYVAEYNSCVWRVSVEDRSCVKWLTTDRLNTISVTSRRLLVTSSHPARLREYSTSDECLLRVVDMPGYVTELYHGVETTRGTFVISHRGTAQENCQDAVSELSSCYDVNCLFPVQLSTLGSISSVFVLLNIGTAW